MSATPANEKVTKLNLSKVEQVDWKLSIEVKSNKVTGSFSYSDDFEGWFGRAPVLNSDHPDIPALKLVKIEPSRQEGGMVLVGLNYETINPEASYPGREAGAVKRYSMDLTSGDEPLLTNHLFKDLSDTEKEHLQELIGSSRQKSDFDAAAAAVTSDAGIKAIAKIRKGVDAFLNPGLIWTEHFTTKDLTDLDLPKILKTTASPPGGCPSGGGERNWLYLGGTAESSQDGKYFDITKKWQLSEKGKWDPDLYPAAA